MADDGVSAYDVFHVLQNAEEVLRQPGDQEKWKVYGPIVAGDQGLGFLTLRAHWDQGAQYLPERRERLATLPDRKPWQATELPSSPTPCLTT